MITIGFAVYIAVLKPCSKKGIIFTKYFNLKQVKFDPNTIRGLMFVELGNLGP